MKKPKICKNCKYLDTNTEHIDPIYYIRYPSVVFGICSRENSLSYACMCAGYFVGCPHFEEGYYDSITMVDIESFAMRFKLK